MSSLQSVRTLAQRFDHDEASGEEEPLASDEDRLRRTLQSIHCAAPRVFLVIQAWAILARRGTIPGTGLEEPPARRGIPAWQEGIAVTPRSLAPGAEALLDDATITLRVAVTPPALQATALWPHALEREWRTLQETAAGSEWAHSIMSLRRVTAEVLRSLPHPMDLQWEVLERRGLTEARRQTLADHLSALTASMPVCLLVASLLADAYGVGEAPADW